MASSARRIAWRSAGGLLLVIIAALALLLVRPEWFLTQSLVSGAARYFLSPLAPTWSVLGVDLNSQSLLEKQIRVNATDFCFHDSSGAVAGCFVRFDAVIDISLSPHGVEVVRVENLLARGQTLRLDLRGPSGPASGGATTRLPVDPRQLLPAPLRRTKLGALDLDLPGMEIRQDSATLTGRLSVTYEPQRKHPLALRVDMKRSAAGRTDHLTASADLASNFLNGGGSGYLDADARLNAGPGVAASFQARLERGRGGQARLDFTASGHDGETRLKVSGDATLAGQRLGAAGALDAYFSTGPVRSLELSSITVAALLQKDGSGVKSLTIDAPYEARIRAFQLQEVKSDALSLQGRLSIDAKAAPRLGQPDRFEADARVVLAPTGDWCKVEGTVTAAASGRTSALDRTEFDRRGTDITVKIAKFDDLVQHLAGTQWAIPAPLDALKGPLTLEARGEARSLEAPLKLTYLFRSDLAGQRQRFKAKVDGDVEIRDVSKPDRSIKVRADAELQDVALQLPRLNVRGLPAFSPDSRIHPHAAPKDAATGLTPSATDFPPLDISLDVRVRTSTAAILYSNLTQTPVPVDLDLTVAGSTPDVEGTITLRAFRAEFFRRNAVIDHIRLTRGKAKAMALDGLIIYKTPDAVIYIRLLGDTDKPQVVLDSSPSMSHSDILSLLIFGQTPDELDPDQQTTLSNTQSAVSQDAFGLASLYLFASTPIQYVGYDPASRGYTVQFRLPGHSSLALGSNATEAERVTLRTRLSAHWAVETEAGHSELQGNVVTTLLEWFNRY